MLTIPLYINSAGELLKRPGYTDKFLGGTSALTLKRGITYRFAVYFVGTNNATPARLAVGAAVSVWLKPKGQFDAANALASATTVAYPATEADPYLVDLLVSSVALDSLMLVDLDTANDPVSIEVEFEVSWTIDSWLTYNATIDRLIATINNNVRRGNESALTLGPEYNLGLTYGGEFSVPGWPLLPTTPLGTALVGPSGANATVPRYGRWVEHFAMPQGGGDLPLIALPAALTVVGSDDLVGVVNNMSFAGNTIQEISFPELTVIGGSLLGAAYRPLSSLLTCSFPKLEVVGQSFTFGNNSHMPELSSISFDALTAVGTDFVIFNSGSSSNLISASFANLTSVGGSFKPFSYLNTSSVSSLGFPSLAYVGGDFVGWATPSGALQDLSFPELVKIGGSAVVLSLGSSALHGLKSIDFSKLEVVAGTLSISPDTSNCGALDSANFPALETVGGTFTTGPIASLKSLRLPALKFLGGDLICNSTPLDAHLPWTPNTRYIAAATKTAPASAFSTDGTTATVQLADSGLAVGDFISIAGLLGISSTSSGYNCSHVRVTAADGVSFSYASTVTASSVVLGTATIQVEASVVFPGNRNRFKYRAIAAIDESGGSPPDWPTVVGENVNDGTITWKCEQETYGPLLEKLLSLDGTAGTELFGANRLVRISYDSGIESLTVNSIAATTGLVTTSTPHFFTPGTLVAVSGCSGTSLPYNTAWSVVTTPSATTFTIAPPASFSAIAGSGSMKVTKATPYIYSSLVACGANPVVNTPADAHDVLSSSYLTNGVSGRNTNDYFADNYLRAVGADVNGHRRYNGQSNGMSLWFDPTLTRWSITPAAKAGQSAEVLKHLYTASGIAFSGTPTGTTTTTITAAGILGGPTLAGSAYIVTITGCTGANTALNGTWQATGVSATAFTIPVTNPNSGTPNGKITVLNQAFSGGVFCSAGIVAPVQAVTATVTTSEPHPLVNGDYVHLYGAQGADASSVNDLFVGATVNSMTSSVTVINSTSFSFTRLASTQPKIGTPTITANTLHVRPIIVSSAKPAMLAAARLRARGVCVILTGLNGI